MRLTLNGKPREIDTGDSGAMPLLALLDALEVNPKLVAVAINGDVTSKSEFATACVCDGDAIEIVRMVGGGSGIPLPLAPSPTGGEGGL